MSENSSIPQNSFSLKENQQIPKMALELYAVRKTRVLWDSVKSQCDIPQSTFRHWLEYIEKIHLLCLSALGDLRSPQSWRPLGLASGA